LKKGKIYVPKDEELRGEVIRLHHDVLAAGHGRTWREIEDSRIGNKKLLVARCDEGRRKIRGRM